MKENGMISKILSKLINSIVDKKIEELDVDKRLLEVEDNSQNIVDINAIRDEINDIVNSAISNHHLQSSIESQNVETRIDKISREVDDSQRVTLQSINSIMDVLENLGDDKSTKVDDKELLKLKSNFTQLVSEEKNKFMRIEQQLESIKNANTKAVSDYEEKINVLMELITDKLVDQETLPEFLKSDVCPFKKKKGSCEIWASRKNKNDAMVFCIPCMLGNATIKKTPTTK